MSEWWTYRLGDFLMFSPATYWRLVENYHRDIWPTQLVGLVAGFTALWLTTLRNPSAARWQALLLAVAWGWVGWAFHWQQFSTINSAAAYLAGAFAVQSILLLGLAAWRPSDLTSQSSRQQRAGWLLAVSGIALYPLMALWAGRPVSQLEVFGMSPEPTALATLGLLLARPQQASQLARWGLGIIPAVSLLVGAATWLAMTNF